VIPDSGCSIETALDISLRSDKYSIADFKRFQVFKSNPGTDLDTITEAACDSSPDCPPHYTINLTVAVCKATVMFY
jgi:hypothetical protein